jgi:mono/diheme cytochrome c family protein
MKFPRVMIAGVVCAAGLLVAVLRRRGQSGGAEKKNSKTAEETWREGRRQFKGNCVICHFETSDKKKVGPGLKGFSVRTTFADGAKITYARIHDLIANGGKDMPPFLDGCERRADSRFDFLSEDAVKGRVASQAAPGLRAGGGGLRAERF